MLIFIVSNAKLAGLSLLKLYKCDNLRFWNFFDISFLDSTYKSNFPLLLIVFKYISFGLKKPNLLRGLAFKIS